MTSGDTASEVIKGLSRRIDFIDCLREEPKDERALVRELGVSRSTVDRGIRELDELGLIRQDDQEYTLTLCAELIVDDYKKFERSVTSQSTIDDQEDQASTIGNDGSKTIRLIAKRVDFLECLSVNSLDKRELVNELDHSRSTVDRAVRELEAADLVQWTREGYTTTPTGRAAAKQYREHIERVGDFLAAADVLQALSPDCSIRPELLVEADVESPAEFEPYQLPTAVREQVETADRLRIALPVLSNPRAIDLCHLRAVRDEIPIELIVELDLFETLRNDFSGPLREMVASDGFAAFSAEKPPFAA